MLDLADQSYFFVWESVEKGVTNEYWSTLKEKITVAKEILSSKYRIGGIFYTSMDVIGGKRFSNNPKNLNHVHKYSKDFLYVIITLGKK